MRRNTTEDIEVEAKIDPQAVPRAPPGGTAAVQIVVNHAIDPRTGHTSDTIATIPAARNGAILRLVLTRRSIDVLTLAVDHPWTICPTDEDGTDLRKWSLLASETCPRALRPRQKRTPRNTDRRGRNLLGQNLLRLNLLVENPLGQNILEVNLLGLNLLGINLLGINLLGINLLGKNPLETNLLGKNLRGRNRLG